MKRKILFAVVAIAATLFAENSFAQCWSRGYSACRPSYCRPSYCRPSTVCGDVCRVAPSRGVERPETLPESCVIAGKTTTCAAETASGDYSASEIALVEAANVERKRRGIAPLRLDASQRVGARRVAGRNAARGRAEHYGMDFVGAEICTPGRDVAEAISMWRSSSAHWGALMSPAYSRVSAGVAYGRGTSFWTLRLF